MFYLRFWLRISKGQYNLRDIGQNKCASFGYILLKGVGGIEMWN